MAEAGKVTGEERLGDLLRTWEEGPSPRVGLQLAEEYRRAGRHDDARAVLERSLESHPGHLSSLVALGKAQLDLDEPAAAAERFETVLERDPTHLVAGKLLIEAHLRRGDGDGARLRLVHYRLLNAGDPELEDLERRTAELEAAGPVAAPQAGAGEAESGETAEVREDGEAAQEVETGAEAGAATEAEAGEDAVARAAEAGPEEAGAGTAAAAAAGEETGGPAAAAAPRAPVEHGAGDPFGPLAEAADERRWLAGLAAPGIFPVELPPEPEPPAAAEEPAAPAEPEEAAAAFAEPEGEEPASVEEDAVAVEPPPEAGEPARAEEPAAAGAGEAEEPAPAEQPALVSVRPEPEAPPALAEPADQEEPPASPPAAEPGERATNTLGELYLVQGHLDDAERVFHAVLARRSDDAAAHAGLAEVARRRRGPFDAAALMRWAADRGRPVTGGDRTARSAALLRAYRDRLDREGRRDVP